jgi:hypothetical protein
MVANNTTNRMVRVTLERHGNSNSSPAVSCLRVVSGSRQRSRGLTEIPDVYPQGVKDNAGLA